MQKIAPLRAKKKKKMAVSFKQLEETAVSTKLSKDVGEKSRKGKKEVPNTRESALREGTERQQKVLKAIASSTGWF